MRGEYIINSKLTPYEMGSPPLARGVQNRLLQESKDKRDHPRLRGEYYVSASQSPKVSGSPPLARGVLGIMMDIDTLGRIAPACAGSTETGMRYMFRIRDHPRLRGEYTKKSLILRDPCLLV